MSTTATKYCGKRKATEATMLTPCSSFTAEHARQNACPWCVGDDYAEHPWGQRCIKCSTVYSTTSDDAGKTPLPCLACNMALTKEVPYLRMSDPSGGTKQDGSPTMRYLHHDGTTCIPKSAHSTSTHPCNGCGKTSDDLELFDASGDDSPLFIACRDCFYKERAALIGDVRVLLQSYKAKRQAAAVTSPKKPAP